MSEFSLSLHIRGDIDELERIAEAMAGFPFVLRHKGVSYPPSKRTMTDNAIRLDLGEWERNWPDDPAEEPALLEDERQHFLAAAKQVQRFAPTLAQLDHTRCSGAVYISTIRFEDWGGFKIPEELVAAAAAAHLAIDLSIAVAEFDDSSGSTQPGDIKEEDAE